MGSSRAADRVRLAGAPMLFAVAFALGALLAVTLPSRGEFAEATDARPGAYALAYLEVLVQANPRDEHLRRAYVRQLTALGRFDEALSALAAAVGDPAHDPDTANLRFDLLLARARALPEGSDDRAQALAKLGLQLAELTGVPQSASRLHDLAIIALSLGNPALAADFSLKRAPLLPAAARAPVLEEAGSWLRASSEEQRAAACFRDAEGIETDARKARDDALDAIAALEAGGMVSDAADLASRYAAKYEGDPRILDRAATLASATNRVSAARDLGRALLERSPDDEEFVLKQVRRELAAGDPGAALPLAERLVHGHPDDGRLRAMRARIAEWSGQPEVALKDWLWLVRHGVRTAHGLEGT